MAKRKVQKAQVADDEQFDNEERLEDIIHYEKVSAIVLAVIFVLLLTLYILLVNYNVTNVYVEGNQHYTAAEIRRMVEQGRFGDNSLYLSMKYSKKSITGIPFIEKMDVNVLDKNSIKITVYEKTLAGFVEYIGNYIYFDKDGIVVESSNVKTPGVPLVSGLEFDHFVMYEQLPVSDTEVFQIVLNLTQLLNKYDITTDRIYFAKDGKITLYFGTVRIGLGSMDLLEEKIQRMNAILPELKDKSGYLEMGNYDEGKDDFTFTLD